MHAQFLDSRKSDLRRLGFLIGVVAHQQRPMTSEKMHTSAVRRRESNVIIPLDSEATTNAMTLLVRESDHPDTSVSFYDESGTLLLQHMAHACLLSRANSLKNLIDSPRRGRRSSAESREEVFGEMKVKRIRLDIQSGCTDALTVEALQTFLQCFYVDLSPNRIDQAILEKITRNLLCLHDLGCRYGFEELALLCEDVAARYMTRELCEGILEHFIDVSTGSIKPAGLNMVTTAVTWARQCTSGFRWRSQLLAYLDELLDEQTMALCDATRPAASRLLIRKCNYCWTVKDSPFPCLIIKNVFFSPTSPSSPVDITIVWKKCGNGDNALFIQPSHAHPLHAMFYVSDFHQNGSWNSRMKIIRGEDRIVTFPMHETERLFYAECMCCKKRAPCFIYCIDMISEETEASSCSMDCD